jgi:streptomycin 6-kinase
MRSLAELGVTPEVIALRERLDGERAAAFLAELPALVHTWEERLGLTGARLMPGGVLSAAFACRAGGDPVVLKLSSAWATSARAEAAALAAWGGEGACRLRFATPDGRVLLLDAIEPGRAVAPGDERSDVRRACALLERLHGVGAPARVPDAVVELDWRFGRAHEKLDGPSHAADLITHAQIDAAHAAATALAQSRDRTVLCHGDFIAKNLLLDAAGEWWAIDPRPCRGDPALDAAFWALNWQPGIRVRERCREVAEVAGLGAGRVWEWACAFAVSEAALVTDRPRALAHYSVVSTSERIR